MGHWWPDEELLHSLEVLSDLGQYVELTGYWVDLHLLYIFPAYCYRPSIPKRMNRKLRNMTTLRSAGSDPKSVLTNFLIEGIALIVLSGLSTLRVRRDLRLISAPIEGTNLAINSSVL